MGLNEFNELAGICPADELLLMRELRIPITGSDAEVILELQEKLSGQRAKIKSAKLVNARQLRINTELKSQIATLEQKQKVLSQENAGLLNQLHNERESHEQSRLLMEKRIALASVRNEDKKPLAATQGVKNEPLRGMRGRMRQLRF